MKDNSKWHKRIKMTPDNLTQQTHPFFPICLEFEFCFLGH